MTFRGLTFQKLRCIFCYFNWCKERLDEEKSADFSGPLLSQQFVSIHRKAISPLSMDEWKLSHLPLSKVEVIATGGIEFSKGNLQADFANKYIGGSVLRDGCVQEEIRFLVIFALPIAIAAINALCGLLDFPRVPCVALLLRGNETQREHPHPRHQDLLQVQGIWPQLRVRR